jgi:hypothetical protein
LLDGIVRDDSGDTDWIGASCGSGSSGSSRGSSNKRAGEECGSTEDSVKKDEDKKNALPRSLKANAAFQIAIVGALVACPPCGGLATMATFVNMVDVFYEGFLADRIYEAATKTFDGNGAKIAFFKEDDPLRKKKRVIDATTSDSTSTLDLTSPDLQESEWAVALTMDSNGTLYAGIYDGLDRIATIGFKFQNSDYQVTFPDGQNATFPAGSYEFVGINYTLSFAPFTPQSPMSPSEAPTGSAPQLILSASNTLLLFASLLAVWWIVSI